MSGGRKPNRVPLKMGGHAFQRVGKDRFPIKAVRSGLFIAEEMIKGNTEKVFFETANRDLPGRIRHELYRVLPK